MNVNGTVSVESGGKISIYSTAAFSNLMLNSGSTLTLTAGSLETKSEPEDNVPAIAQIWVNGGTLNAAGGSIAGGSTVYYTSGTMSLPSNLAGVSVGYRVISLEELTAALSDIRVTSVMIQDSFSASGNVILSKDTMELLEHGIGDGAAHAAADHADLLLALSLCGLAQRADKVLQALPLIQVAQLFRGGAGGLHDDTDCSLFAVIVVDCEGDSLPVFIHTQNDKLAGLCLLRNQRCLNLIQDHRRFERLFSDDSKHSSPSFSCSFAAIVSAEQ